MQGHKEIGKVGRDSPLFFGVLVALFVVVAALSLFLLSGERRRNALLAEYQAEQLAGALLETARDGQTPRDFLDGDRLLGFGLYSGDGVAVERLGSAPASIDVPDQPLGAGLLPEPYFRHDRERRTLTLIRPLGMPPTFHGRMRPQTGHSLPRMMDRMGPQPGSSPRDLPRRMVQFVFLELAAEGFYARQRMLALAQLLLPLTTLGAMAFVAILYRNNQAIRRALAAREQMARLGEASRTLTHEIKNPLSAIRIQTAVLKKTLPQARRGELRVIEEETMRLAVLTDRIGDFLRDPLGQPESVDLDRFIRELVLRYDRKIQYTSPADGALRTVFDPQRLRSVLENLINNALEAAGDQSVEITTRVSRHEIVVSVLDRGPGIPEEVRSKVFDPFFTSKVQGSGVGLAISRRFVEAAAGTLVLANREGGGTEARMTVRRELG
jgi:two-component system sensor histidine kinase HydH